RKPRGSGPRSLMGRRSRKRGVPERSGAGVAASSTSRAERDEARQRRAEAMSRGESPAPRRRRPGKTSFEDRPPAPWGKFPLVEIVVLIALVLLELAPRCEIGRAHV